MARMSPTPIRLSGFAMHVPIALRLIVSDDEGSTHNLRVVAIAVQHTDR